VKAKRFILGALLATTIVVAAAVVIRADEQLQVKPVLVRDNKIVVSYEY